MNTITKTAATAVLALSMLAGAADARPYHHHRRHYYDRQYEHHRHYRECRTTGTVAGVVLGGVLGNAVTHHSAAGTVVGAGVGGVAGHQIARANCSRRR